MNVNLTLIEEPTNKIGTFEYKALRRLINIIYYQIKTNIYISTNIRRNVGIFEPLLDTIKVEK